MKIGYTRVSTADQNLTIQLTQLNAAGCERIFQEKITGAHADRPQLRKMLEQLRVGDVVVVWKLDRLARSTKDLLEITAQITAATACFRSLTESWAETETAAGKMILTIFAGIAEFERSLILERTGTGRSLAKARGVRFGRPKKLSSEQVILTRRLLQEGKSAREVASTFQVHTATIYRMIGPSGMVTVDNDN